MPAAGRTSARKTVRKAAERPYHHGDLRRALIDAALKLVREEQDWTFSLREVARRAGVSHNAPYNHFADKDELLAAVAAAGFESLRARLLPLLDSKGTATELLFAGVSTYVETGVANPALFRLMFGPTLVGAAQRMRPAPMREAGLRARAVLDEVILRGARSGEFAIPPADERAIKTAMLAIWSVAHGLTTLLIDNLVRIEAPVAELIDGVLRVAMEGLAPRLTPARKPVARRIA